MTISIAMTTYNGEKYVQEQLDSFALQTRTPDELVICDDGSTDSTVEICKKFSTSVPFDVYVYENEKKLGYTKNFEKALKKCKADVLCISDQDDVWYPHKIERVAKTFEEYQNIDLLIHDLQYCNSCLEPIGQTKIARIATYNDPKKAYVTGMSTALRRDFYSICTPFPENSSMTYDKWIHWIAYILNRKMVINEVLAAYRRHDTNITAKNSLNVAEKKNKYYFVINKIRRKLVPMNTESIGKSISKLEAKKKWLEEKKDQLVANRMLSEDAVNNLIDETSLAIERRIQRTRIYSMSKIGRLIPVIKLLRSGGYKDAKGYKSALKDIFL